MKIGNVKLENNLILGPMDGVTDIGFRLLCKKYGASLVYTEMVNSEALIRNNNSAKFKAKICEEENKSLAKTIIIEFLYYYSQVTYYIFKNNYYFMMGDNRYDSRDSRYVGMIPENRIIGRTKRILFSTHNNIFQWNRLFKRLI